MKHKTKINFRINKMENKACMILIKQSVDLYSGYASLYIISAIATNKNVERRQLCSAQGEDHKWEDSGMVKTVRGKAVKCKQLALLITLPQSKRSWDERKDWT